ncbi:MAG: glutamate-1-semialdehyde 2,1-aminomutase [Peptococcaceae bacterium]|nr:glutamate-1-semialdehyde 2,1-aminomutase [Peptococcaceae bacterium]
MNKDKSRLLYQEALRYLPGGVNSPVRSFAAVGGEPLFVDRARGAVLVDADGNEYIDYVLSWGPLILGHRHPGVREAIGEALGRGWTYGAPTAGETELARLINRAMPALEMVRLVSSGTEAAMSALRLARAFTGRDRILKFEGCYHGHADALLIGAGSGALTMGVPTSPGVTAGVAADTLVSRYNDLELTRDLFRAYGEEIAAVIVEPVAGNMGVVEPAPGFLAGLKALTMEYGCLLIFDEVITGFRVGLGGAQELYGVAPDLTCLGKIIGGGLPVGAYGGRRDIMAMVAPVGPVYQAGTLSGNPLAVAAGAATLQTLREPEFYPRLAARAAALARGLRELAGRHGVPVTVNRAASLLTVFFTEGPVTGYAEALRSDTARYAAFFQGLLDSGVYFPPAQFEAVFLSACHDDVLIARTLTAAEKVFRDLGRA